MQEMKRKIGRLPAQFSPALKSDKLVRAYAYVYNHN